MARPQLDIDPALVERLAKIDCTVEEIAAVVGCTTKTLQRRFVHLIEKGRQAGNKSLRRKQFAVAMKGNVSMLIWLGKQRLGQKEPVAERPGLTPEEIEARVAKQIDALRASLPADVAEQAIVAIRPAWAAA